MDLFLGMPVARVTILACEQKIGFGTWTIEYMYVAEKNIFRRLC